MIIDYQEPEIALSGRFFYVRFSCIFPIICRKTAEYYSISLAFIQDYIHFPSSCIPRLPQHYILYINYSLNYAFTNSCVIFPLLHRSCTAPSDTSLFPSGWSNPAGSALRPSFPDHPHTVRSPSRCTPTRCVLSGPLDFHHMQKQHLTS